MKPAQIIRAFKLGGPSAASRIAIGVEKDSASTTNGSLAGNVPRTETSSSL